MGRLLVNLASMSLLGMSEKEALRFYIVGHAAAHLSWIAHVAGMFFFFLVYQLVPDDHVREEPLAFEIVEEPRIVEEEPEPEVEEEPPAPPPEEEPAVQPRPRPRVEEEPPPPPPEEAPPPPPQEEAIEDFTGMTLTNPSNDGWQSNVGNGAAINAPLGQPNAERTGRVRHGQQDGIPGGTGEEGPRIVDASDLSREPQIPDLDRLRRLLEDNYPRQAQELGIEGNAVVRIHVHSDGRVQPLRVVRESHAGFGEACRRTLSQGGRWDPPLDRAGREVDTITTFRCTFSFRF